MNNGSKKWLWLAHLHLLLVVAGAAGWSFDRPDFFSRAVRFYGAASGADNRYGFFAPGVSYELRALFELRDGQGKATIHTWEEEGLSREAYLRFTLVVQTLRTEVATEKTRRSIVASLAGYMLGRHPEARDVRVKLERYVLPSMAAYHAGSTGKWAPFYEASFTGPRRFASGGAR